MKSHSCVGWYPSFSVCFGSVQGHIHVSACNSLHGTLLSFPTFIQEEMAQISSVDHVVETLIFTPFILCDVTLVTSL